MGTVIYSKGFDRVHPCDTRPMYFQTNLTEREVEIGYVSVLYRRLPVDPALNFWFSAGPRGGVFIVKLPTYLASQLPGRYCEVSRVASLTTSIVPTDGKAFATRKQKCDLEEALELLDNESPLLDQHIDRVLASLSSEQKIRVRNSLRGLNIRTTISNTTLHVAINHSI